MYSEMFEYVKKILEVNKGEDTKKFPFRKRSDHIKRVFLWTKRLIHDGMKINREALFISALFHDSGYQQYNKVKHAEKSAVICRRYLQDKGYQKELIDFVVYLVKNHSNKSLLNKKGTPLELILLIEADLLDETGALSIVWDCMLEGHQVEQSFEKTYDHIMKYSLSDLNENPMITPKAKQYWEEKQKLINQFTHHLEIDLGINQEILIKR